MKFSLKKTSLGLDLIFDPEDTPIKTEKGEINFYIAAEANHPDSHEIFHSKKLLLSEEINTQNLPVTVHIPHEKIEGYVYRGKYVKMYYQAHFLARNALIPSNSFEQDFENADIFKVITCKTTPKLKKGGSAGINFAKTFKTMPLDKKILCCVYLLIFVASLVGYSLGIEAAMIATIIAGGMLAVSTMSGYDYIKAELMKPLPQIHKDTKIKLEKLINAVPVTNLKDLTVAVIGSVMENGMLSFKGQNKRPGVKTSFTEKINDFVFFEQTIPLIQAKTPIESYISEELNFGKLYENLSPIYKLNNDYGVGFEVKIHFWSPEYPDKSIALPNEAFDEPK